MFYMIMYIVLVGDIISCIGEISDIDGEYIMYVDKSIDYTFQAISRRVGDTAMMGLGF